MASAYEQLRERYNSGEVPWDDPLPPPEVQATVALMSAGRALDLGTGYGRAAIYLANLGWDVDAVDFIDLAVKRARERARAAALPDIRFHHSDISDMPFLDGPYDFVLDVGCLHGLDPAGQAGAVAEIRRLLRAGGRYLLFAHLRDPEGDEPDRWLDEPTFLRLMADGFTLERVEHGVTQVGENPPWRSAWYWFRRVQPGGERPGT
jgi:SAM-dependent methyltransferase